MMYSLDKNNPENIFKASFFSQNREKLLSKLPEGAVVVLAAHSLMQRSRDTAYPFRQESNFWYLTGIQEPGCVLFLSRKESFVVAPQRSITHEIFDGAISPSELQAISGLDEIYPSRSGWRHLRELCQQASAVYTRLPAKQYYQPAGLQLNGAAHRLVGRLKRIKQLPSLQDVTPTLQELRLIKQPSELVALRNAIAVTSQALEQITIDLTSYNNEREIAAELSYIYQQNGMTHGYEPIVASGKNACTLHYVENNQLITSNQLLLIDSGAEFFGYSADITRTFAVGELSQRQKHVHQGVADLQQQAFALFRPGVSLRDIERAFMDIMAVTLRELSLITGNQQKDIRCYYPHALSHYLGLDVHDVGSYDTPLEPGMVLTVEPGIYIPEEAMGVRIEDNILITESSYQNLTKDCQQPRY